MSRHTEIGKYYVQIHGETWQDAVKNHDVVGYKDVTAAVEDMEAKNPYVGFWVKDHKGNTMFTKLSPGAFVGVGFMNQDKKESKC